MYDFFHLPYIFNRYHILEGQQGSQNNKTMRLDDIIRKYRQIKITQAIAENSSCAELNSLLNEVDANLSILIQDRTSDPFGACLIFSEMALRKIGSIAPICAYYYATMAQSQTTIPASSKVDAIRMRLFSVFSNLDIFERFIMMAHSAPMMGYNGSLNDEEFFDFIIMGDTYRVWDIAATWKLEGVFEDIMDSIHGTARKIAGKYETPYPQLHTTMASAVCHISTGSIIERYLTIRLSQ